VPEKARFSGKMSMLASTAMILGCGNALVLLEVALVFGLDVAARLGVQDIR
jgi:hypothetical protein